MFNKRATTTNLTTKKRVHPAKRPARRWVTMTWELIVVVLLVGPRAGSPADSPLLVSFGHAISWFSTCKTRISCGAWRRVGGRRRDRSVGFSGLELVEINRNALGWRGIPTWSSWLSGFGRWPAAAPRSDQRFRVCWFGRERASGYRNVRLWFASEALFCYTDTLFW